MALHDIGKPRAIREGNKKLQHKYNPSLVEAILKELEFSRSDILIAKVIVSSDLIGEYLKRGKIKKIHQVITSEANKIGFRPIDLFHHEKSAGRV